MNSWVIVSLLRRALSVVCAISWCSLSVMERKDWWRMETLTALVVGPSSDL